VFLTLSKLLDWLLAPLSWALLLLLAAAILRGRPRVAGLLAALGVAVLVAFSTEAKKGRDKRERERERKYHNN
jgi:hypothetical protein